MKARNARNNVVDIEGKVTIVTGASSGIGAAIARTFAAAGSRVVLTARREQRLRDLANEISADGGEALVAPGDVTDYEQVREVVRQAEEHFGSADVMVNNAGYALSKSLTDSSVDEIRGQIDVNLTAVAYGCKAVLGGMIERGEGYIVNIGSICSVNAYPDYAAYVAAKFGVLGFSRSLYEEVREKGVRVNCLCPAAVNTEWAGIAGADLPWSPADRLQPEDLADAALYCVTAPKRVHIEQITLWPTCEPTV